MTGESSLPVQRYVVPPPQPVDPENPIWLARWYQWATDKLMHLDECMDSMKEDFAETKVEMSVQTQMSLDRQDSLGLRLDEHKTFHELMEAGRAGGQKMLKMQWRLVENILRVVSSATVLGLALWVLKLIGVKV